MSKKTNQIIDKVSSNEDRDKKIVQMALEGVSYADIGKIFNLTKARISQIALENKVVRRPSDLNIEHWANIWKDTK